MRHKKRGMGGRVRKILRRCVHFCNFFKTDADAAACTAAGRGVVWLVLRICNEDYEWLAAIASCQKESAIWRPQQISKKGANSKYFKMIGQFQI